MKDLLSDFRFGFRYLLKNPLFTLAGILTLALGIGANTAIFSLVNGVLLRPLPFADPERLFLLSQLSQEAGSLPVSFPNYLDWRKDNRVFEDMAGYIGTTATVGASEPKRLTGTRVTASFFHVLGVRPFLGRTFAVEEDTPSGERVVMLSHALWQREFGGDTSLLGKQVVFNGESHTVIGIMPERFDFPAKTAEFWLPLRARENSSRDLRYLKVIGRMRQGVPVATAQQDMDRIATRLAKEYPEENAGQGVELVPLREWIVGKVRPVLLILFGAVSFVLLITCVNTANMLLSRVEIRRKEFALRGALGARRLRLVRQCLSESVLLFLLGGGAGVLLAYALFRGLIAVAPYDIPRLDEVAMDGPVLLFSLLISVLTGLLFGLVPALQSSTLNLRSVLSEESGGSTAGARRKRMQNLLVVCEVALALMLLIGAFLLVRSFGNLRAIDPGFKTENVLTFRLPLPSRLEVGSEAAVSFYNELIRRIEALPQVETAAVVASLPGTSSISQKFTIEGRATASGQEPLADYNLVTPDYFKVMTIPLLAGRPLAESDNGHAVPVALINQAMAQRFWPNGAPIGKRVKFGDATEEGPWVQIVGIVADVKHHGLAADVEPEVYQPFSQVPDLDEMAVVLRTTSDPLALAPAVRRTVWAVDGSLPVVDLLTMEQRLSDSLAKARFNALMLTIFSLVAVALALVGIYGVISYTVNQKLREIGVRMALGSSQGQALRWVLGQQMRWVVLGLLIGLCGAFALTRSLTSLLFGVGAVDPLTFAGGTLLLMATAGLACYLPARQAKKVNPAIALHHS